MNGRRVRSSYQQLFSDIDDFYYNEYYELEEELVLKGFPRSCLDWDILWDAILIPKSLLDWSIHSLPLTTMNLMFHYLTISTNLPSFENCLHEGLAYGDGDGGPPVDIFEHGLSKDEEIDEEISYSADWNEFFFQTSVSHEEYEMALHMEADE